MRSQCVTLLEGVEEGGEVLVLVELRQALAIHRPSAVQQDQLAEFVRADGAFEVEMKLGLGERRMNVDGLRRSWKTQHRDTEHRVETSIADSMPIGSRLAWIICVHPCSSVVRANSLCRRLHRK